MRAAVTLLLVTTVHVSFVRSFSCHGQLPPAFSRHRKSCNGGCLSSPSWLPKLANTSDNDETSVFSSSDHKNNDDNKNNPRFHHPISSEQDIFRLMEEIGGTLPERYNRTASTRTFNMVLRELASTRRPWAGSRAEEIFVYMLERHLKKNDNGGDGGGIGIEPDVVTFNRYVQEHSVAGCLCRTFV